MKNISRNVSLKCEVCGNDQFDFDEIDIENGNLDTIVVCSDCGNRSKYSDLREANSYNIDANLKDMEKDIEKEVLKELEKAFKKLR